jgi:5-formyltetrahydrofolate cyclo-ligase
MNKPAMRASMTAALMALPPAALAERSARVARGLEATAEWSRAGVVLCFLTMQDELDTAPIISAARAQGKAVAVPRSEGRDIRFVVLPPDAGSLPRDRWGIPVPDERWEPLDIAAAARPLVAAPGLAFDRQGNRLGRGRGYYDRFLARARAAAGDVAVIAVCFAVQLVEEVPHGDNDQRVDAIVTEEETIIVAHSARRS